MKKNPTKNKMAAKKKVTMGVHKGKECTVTRKKPKSTDNIIIKVDGNEIEINKAFVK